MPNDFKACDLSRLKESKQPLTTAILSELSGQVASSSCVHVPLSLQHVVSDKFSSL